MDGLLVGPLVMLLVAELVASLESSLADYLVALSDCCLAALLAVSSVDWRVELMVEMRD